jgi:DNA-binding transcriptional LysR family regulator
VTTPLNFDFMGSVFAAFAKRYDEVTLEIMATDRVVNMVDEGFDVAVRAGSLADSTLVARQLAKLERIAVASPAYVKKRGRPRTPTDLAEHDCLHFGTTGERPVWRMEEGTSNVEVAVKPRIVVNDFDVLYEAAIGGIGIAMMPVFRCVADLRERRLEHLLSSWCSPPVPVSAVYPSARHLSPKVKAFVEHLEESFSPPPWVTSSGGTASPSLRR